MGDVVGGGEDGLGLLPLPQLAQLDQPPDQSACNVKISMSADRRSRDEYQRLGTIAWTILDEFSENFQTASDPPPALVSENYVALFSGGPKICNEIHSDWRDPPPFFRKFIVFTPPKLPKKPQRNFLDRK